MTFLKARELKIYMGAIQPKCWEDLNFQLSSLFKSQFIRPLKTPIFEFPGTSPGFWSELKFSDVVYYPSQIARNRLDVDNRPYGPLKVS